MSTRITERRIVDVLVSHLRKRSEVRREVRHYEKRIDVLTYCPAECRLTAIEEKSRDWKRALQQAILNLTAAEFCYIAMFSSSAHRVDRARLEEFGIGLMSVGSKWGDVQVLVEAKKSPYTNRFVRAQLIGAATGAEDPT